MVYTYTFTVDAPTFHRLLYFNAFARSRVQMVLVVAIWIGATVLTVLNIVGCVYASSVMLTCCLAVLLTVPLLVYSCERDYRSYRNTLLPNRQRTISLCEDWIKLKIAGEVGSDKIEWRNVSAAYETRDGFVFYRNADQMVLLPKSSIGEDELDALRGIFRRNLGRAFKIRVRRDDEAVRI